jgi:hypothetical protein
MFSWSISRAEAEATAQVQDGVATDITDTLQLTGETVEEGDTVIVPTYDAARKREVVRKAVVAHKNHLVPAEALTHPLKKIIGVLRKIK